MKSKRLMLTLSMGVIVALLLAACATGGQEAEAPETDGGETTEETTGGEDTGAEDTGAEDAGAEEDMAEEMDSAVVIALYQEPESLNPYLSVQTVVNVVATTIMDGLLDVAPDGEFIAKLAVEVPSIDNGGISEDGLTLTYKLREGILWADGAPFTSADVKFTWDAVMDDSNAVVSRAGYDLITSIETPDDLTVVITFSELYSPALLLFEYVLPAHAFGGGTAMTGADFNRMPFGTGPYMVSEWASGEAILLDANPNYRDSVNFEGVIFRITPSREASVLLLKSGEAEVVWDLIEASIPDFKDSSEVSLWTSPSSNVEYLGLNLALRGDPGDPSQPHAILGDIRVRQAISLGIDRSVLVDDLMYGLSTIGTSAIGMGWAADPSLSIPEYDPAAAAALLADAGWADSDDDGVLDKDGTSLTLEITTTSGNKLRELAEQVIQAQLLEIGIELVINNVPSSTLFGNWASGGTLQRGNFDVGMDTWGPDIDPDGFVSILFHSSSVPSEDGGGWNFFRIQSDAVDAAIEAGRSTVDVDARKEAYSELAGLINDTFAYIPLYNRLLIQAYNSDITGWTPNPWEEFTWDIANWDRE